VVDRAAIAIEYQVYVLTALIILPPYISVVWKFWEKPSPGKLIACPGL
jgi:hypothetical protein